MKSILQKIINEEVNKAFVLLSEGIIHLDKMKPKALLHFLKLWNLDKSKFHVSEKMDGNFMALGVNNGEFYLRSKSMIFTSIEQIPNIFFMNDFKKYFLLLKSLPWNSIFEEMSNKYKFDFDGTFELEGEAIPSFDHNIVIYDEAKIGDGVFVIFNSKTSVGKEKSGRIHNVQMWEEVAGMLNASGKVKFFVVPEISMSGLEFDNNIIIDLEELIKTHGNFLAKPARTPGAKELKSKLLSKVAEMGLKAKNHALTHPTHGKFGPEIEGIVVTGPDGELVKIVDTNKFTQRKTSNWHFIDKLITAERNFKKAIKENGPADLERFLSDWKLAVENVEKDFSENVDEYITINKKIEDTKNSIEYAKGIINAMNTRLVSGQSPEQVAEDFKSRKILPESQYPTREKLFESSLQEGGNVFDEMNSVVPKPLLMPTVEKALEVSGLGSIPFEIVGNKTKKFFNDIDIAVDAKDLAKFLHLSGEDKREIWPKLDKYLRTSGVERFSINKGLSQFHILVPLLDSSGEQVLNFLPNGDRGNEPAFIQIDVFVGNLGWMTSVNSGAPKNSKHKAKFRNVLLGDIAREIRIPSGNNEYTRFVFNFRDGLRRQKIRLVPPTGRQRKVQKVKIEDYLVTTDPNEMAKTFFGNGTSWQDINSYEKLRGALQSDKFKYKNFLPNILSAFKKDTGL